MGLQAVINGPQFHLGPLYQHKAPYHTPVITTQIGCDFLLTEEGSLDKPKLKLFKCRGLQVLDVLRVGLVHPSQGRFSPPNC